MAKALLLTLSCLVAIAHSLPFPQQLTEEDFKRGRSIGLPDNLEVLISPSYSQVRRQGGRSFSSEPIKFPTLTVKDPNQLSDIRKDKPTQTVNGPVYNVNFDDVDDLKAKIEAANLKEQERLDAEVDRDLIEAGVAPEAVEAMREEAQEEVANIILEGAADNLATLDMIQKMAGLDGEAGEAIDNIIVDTLAEEMVHAAIADAEGGVAHDLSTSDIVDLKSVDIGSIMEVQHDPQAPTLTVEEAAVSGDDLLAQTDFVSDIAAAEILEEAFNAGKGEELAAQLEPLLEEAVSDAETIDEEFGDAILRLEDEYAYEDEAFEENLDGANDEIFDDEISPELNEIVDFASEDDLATTVIPSSSWVDEEEVDVATDSSIAEAAFDAEETDGVTPSDEDDFGLIQEVTTASSQPTTIL